jgi:hypothetical protein
MPLRPRQSDQRGIIASMIRWLRHLLGRKQRPVAPRIVAVMTLPRKEVPVGRRRITTTADDFEAHLTKRRSETR